jgi:hypothetical protein
LPAAFGVFAIVAACGSSQSPQAVMSSLDGGGGSDDAPTDAQTTPDEEAASSPTEAATRQCTPGDGSGGVSQTDAGCELNLLSSGCSVRCSCPEDLCWCNGSTTPVHWGACPACGAEAGGGLPPHPCF